MKFVEFIAVGPTGAPLPGAQVYVYPTGAEPTLAGVYNLLGAGVANPLTASAAGLVGFAAPNGTYDIQIVSGAYSAPVIQNVQIVDEIGVLSTLSSIAGLTIVAGSIVYATQALLFADLAHAAGTVGVVYSDPTPANDGIYVKQGASGSGSWTITTLTWVSTPLAQAAATAAQASAIAAAAAVAEINALLTYTGLANVYNGPQLSLTYSYQGAETNPSIVDANMNCVVAVDGVTGQPLLPGPKLMTVAGLTAAPTIMMTIHYGQSLAAGIFGGPARSVTHHGAYTFGSGPKAMSSSNIFGASGGVLSYPESSGPGSTTTSPGLSTFIALAEDNNYSWAPYGTGAGQAESGETSITASLDETSAAVQAFNGLFTDSILRFFGSSPARGGEILAALIPTAATWLNVQAHIAAFAAGCATLSGAPAPNVLDCVFSHGESDGDVNTPYGTYLSEALTVVAAMDLYARQTTGQLNPVVFFVNQTSHSATIGGGPIAQAQVDLTFMDPRCRLLPPNYPYPRSQNPHLTNDGYALRGYYEGKARAAVSFTAGIGAYTAIRPLTAKYSTSAATLTATFEVPTAPLRIGYDNPLVGGAAWSPTFQSGFKVQDNAGNIAINSIAIGANGISVVFTLARAPGAGAVLRMGLDYASSSNQVAALENSANTDLKDSTTGTFTPQGSANTYITCYVGPHYSLTVSTVP